MVSLFGFCMNTTIGEAKWNYDPDTYEFKEPMYFGLDEKCYTDTTLVYRSGIERDLVYETETAYPCTQGIDRNGRIVPLTAQCLVPFTFNDDIDYYVPNAESGLKYSFMKKNKEGRLMGTNDPAEAYTFCEMEELFKGKMESGMYRDNEGYFRYKALQPTVTVNITLRIDWDQTNKLLDLINADRAEVGAAPLVLDKYTTELALQKNAELYVLSTHKTPDTLTLSEKWDIVASESKLTHSGENVDSGKTFAKSLSYEQCKDENEFANITDEWTQLNHQGYKNSKGHYNNYTNSKHIAAGLCMVSNGFTDKMTAQEFSTGSVDDIVPLVKTGLENRTFQVTMIDTAFDYYLQNPISEIEPGENHKLANYAAPVDYWWVNTFDCTGYTEDFIEHAGTDIPPFDFSSLTFSSSDESVATVDKKGFVTGIKEGTAIITTSLQGKHVKEIPITVKKKEELIPTPTPTPPKASDRPAYYNPIVNPAPDENIKETVKYPVKVDYTAAQWKTIIETSQIKKAKNVKKRKISLSWSKVTYEGYTLSKKFKVEYALNKSFTKEKKTKTVTGLKTTLSNLKKGKVYYIRMKVYVQTPNGKKMWLPYGKVKKVKVKR